MDLWRAVGDGGNALDVLVQKRRNAVAAIKPLRTLMKNHGAGDHHDGPIDLMRSGSRRAGMKGRHRPGGMLENDRVENSRLVARRRSENSRSSCRRAQPDASSPHTPLSTTPSIFSLTLPPAPLSASCALTLMELGKRRLLLPDS